MDLGTLIGFVIGSSLVLFGIMTPDLKVENVIAFIDIPSLFMVAGGALGAMVISIPLGVVKNMPGVLGKALFYKATSPLELIDRMVHFAEVARRDGILALEGVTEDIQDEYLVKGIQLAVDGTDPELIVNIMTTELENLETRHSEGKKMFDLMTKYAPAWGMIGTVVGLILMLKDMDPSSIGPNMAIALVTTFYGAVAANLLVGPIGDKLALRNAEEILTKQIILKGVMAIQTGDNPRIVDQKLRIFLPPKLRKAKEE